MRLAAIVATRIACIAVEGHATASGKNFPLTAAAAPGSGPSTGCAPATRCSPPPLAPPCSAAAYGGGVEERAAICSVCCQKSSLRSSAKARGLPMVSRNAHAAYW